MPSESIIELIVYAMVFIILFFIGGLVGTYSFPNIPGIFYITGLLFAIFGTGAGTLIIKFFIR